MLKTAAVKIKEKIISFPYLNLFSYYLKNNNRGKNMEIEKLLEGLSEEQKAKFLEKVKKDAEKAVKTAAEEREKEEAKKLFSGFGSWDLEDGGKKYKAVIDQNDRKYIKIFLGNDHIIELSKSEFFNIQKLLSRVYKSVKDEHQDLFDSIDDQFPEADKISELLGSCSSMFPKFFQEIELNPSCRKRRNNQIFHIR